MAPLTEWKESTSVDEFLQTHYRELTKEQLDDVIQRLEQEAKKDYGAEVNISDIRPQKGVKFGYALNLSICVGCRRCAKACHEENNHDRASGNSYIRVLEMTKGSMDMEHGNATTTIPSPSQTSSTCPYNANNARTHPVLMSALWKPLGRNATASLS